MREEQINATETVATSRVQTVQGKQIAAIKTETAGLCGLKSERSFCTALIYGAIEKGDELTSVTEVKIIPERVELSHADNLKTRSDTKRNMSA